MNNIEINKYQPSALSNYIKLILYSIILALLIGIFYSSFGKISADSPVYINNSNFVPFLYPLYIDILAIFSSSESYKLVGILQFIIGYYLTILAVIKFAKTFNLIFAIEFFIFLAQIHFFARYGHIFYSEALAYPVFMLFFSYFIGFLVNKNLKDFGLSMFFLTIAFASRYQFLFVYPVVFLYLFLTTTNANKFSKLRLYIYLLLSFIIGFYSNHMYNFFKYHKFEGVKSTGISMFVDILYVSKAEDEKLFVDPEIKSIFKEIYQYSLKYNALKYCNPNVWQMPNIKQMKALHITNNNWARQPQSYYNSLKQSFNKYSAIYGNETNCEIDDLGHQGDTMGIRGLSIHNAFVQRGITDWGERDHYLKQLVKPLLINNFYPWIKIKIKAALSYNFGIYVLGAWTIAALFVVLNINRLDFKCSILFIAIYLLCISNSIIISIFTPYPGSSAATRYLIYNYSMLFTLYFVLLNQLNQILFLNKRSQD